METTTEAVRTHAAAVNFHSCIHWWPNFDRLNKMYYFQISSSSFVAAVTIIIVLWKKWEELIAKFSSHKHSAWSSIHPENLQCKLIKKVNELMTTTRSVVVPQLLKVQKRIIFLNEHHLLLLSRCWLYYWL